VGIIPLEAIKMQAQIESLRKKIMHIRYELEEVQQELERLENGLTKPATNGKEGNSADTGTVRLISDEELYQMMLNDGVKPEDCIGSRGIIEMREE
jgi:hypothetical protein